MAEGGGLVEGRNRRNTQARGGRANADTTTMFLLCIGHSEHRSKDKTALVATVAVVPNLRREPFAGSPHDGVNGRAYSAFM